MDFDTYQLHAATTAMYPNIGANIYYPTLGLASEAGEVAGKVKKIMRDHHGAISDEKKAELKGELGDVLWYVAMTAGELDLSLGDVAKANLRKLSSRKERGKLGGDGDDR